MIVALQSCDNEHLPDFMKSEGALVSDTITINPYKNLIINNRITTIINNMTILINKMSFFINGYQIWNGAQQSICPYNKV